MTTIEFILRLSLSLSLIWFIMFFLIIVHEYGHVAACNLLKIKPDKMVIGWPVVFSNEKGGLTHEYGVLPVFGYVHIDNIELLPLRVRAQMAAAGPITSLLLGLFFIGIDWIHPLWLINLAGHSSLTLAALNLIPLPPFDGWPVFQYLLSRKGVKVSSETQKLLTTCGIVMIGMTVMVIGRWGGL